MHAPPARRTLSRLLAALAMAAAGGLAAQPAAAAPPAPPGVTRTDVINYFSSITGRNWLSGQQDGPNSNPTQWTDKAHDITGLYPGVWGGDFGFSQNDIDNRQRVFDQAKAAWNAGTIPAITWHACAPVVATCNFEGGSWPVKGSRLSDAQWNDLVTSGGSLNNAWKQRLEQAVPYFQQLKDAGIPVLFRPSHEMNEAWSWWGGRPGANGSRKLFQITHDYLVGRGLSNIVWVWNVKDLSGGAGSVADYYPGDSYVDLVTLDVWVQYFPTSDWYQAMQNISHGKPIALAEVGRTPIPAQMAAQPKWTYFSVWMDWLVNPQYNTNAGVQATYYDARVLNRGEISIPTGTPPAGGGPITGVGGKCVDVPGANTANGTQVQLWACNGNSQQSWSVNADGTVRALGKCLDVNGGINADGTKVQLWDCVAGNTHQRWSYSATSKALTNPETGRCLNAGAAADGTALQIWACNGSAGQQWTLATGSGGGTGPVASVATGKCMDVPGAQTTNGLQVQIWTCNGSTAQAWTVGADGTIRGLGKCLDVSGGVNANGTKVQIWDCVAGSANQRWSYSSAAKTLTNPATGRCLDVTGQGTADGTKLQIWACNGQSNQQWNLPA